MEHVTRDLSVGVSLVLFAPEVCRPDGVYFSHVDERFRQCGVSQDALFELGEERHTRAHLYETVFVLEHAMDDEFHRQVRHAHHFEQCLKYVTIHHEQCECVFGS